MTVKEFLEMNIESDSSYDLVEIWDTYNETRITDGTIQCIMDDDCDFLNCYIESWNLDTYNGQPMLCLNIDYSEMVFD